MATGYVRQSAADIVSGEVVRAAPLNNEFNAIRDAFSTASGHNHDGTTGGGAYISTVSDSDNDTKVVADGATNSVQVSTAGTERMRVNSSGNVGIGTTSPAAKLEVRDVNGTIIASNSATRYGFMQWENTIGALRFGTDGSFPIRFDTASTERMRIDASGNVGINTNSPGSTLDMRGPNGLGVRYIETATGNTNRIQFGTGAGFGYIDATAGIGSPSLVLQTASTERMRIDGSGTFNFNGNILTNIASPSSSADVVTKGYVDSAVALGGSLTADVNLSGFKITNMGTPTASADATTKSYVDTADTNNRNLTYYSLQVI